ncbi:MAG: hypothetical protein QOF30_1251 [Acidimicrobiaceae bacterium]|jgi:uncharacterized protein (TIGR03083 family)|nr:hypothetical protein [Acidimicrobiaceae bacterium]
MDLVAQYAQTQARIVELVTPLAPAALGTRVPGTPCWTVEELVAHLVGVAADMIDDNHEGGDFASVGWTARQVAERAGRPLAHVLAEWSRRTPEVLALLATPGRADACAFDIFTHEHDLRGALGLAGPSDAAAVAAMANRVQGRLHHLIDQNDLPAVWLVHDDGEWVCGSGDIAVSGRAATFEWYRTLFGRRSAAQILTYQWEGDPRPYFGLFNLFGPLPSADVAEAGAPVPRSGDGTVVATNR